MRRWIMKEERRPGSDYCCGRPKDADLGKGQPACRKIERQQPPCHSVVEVVDQPWLTNCHEIAILPTRRPEHLEEGRLRGGSAQMLGCFKTSMRLRFAHQEYGTEKAQEDERASQQRWSKPQAE